MNENKETKCSLKMFTMKVIITFLFLGLFMHFAYPKYYFNSNFRIRGNKITGEVYHYYEGGWNKR